MTQAQRRDHLQRLVAVGAALDRLAAAVGDGLADGGMTIGGIDRNT